MVEELNLERGLIAFGGRPGMGLTRLTLKIASELSKTERVLFTSYQSDAQSLKVSATKMEGYEDNNLIIDSSSPYYDYEYFPWLKQHLRDNKISTLIIDDLNNLIEPHQDEKSVKDSIISQYKEISNEFEIRIILNCTVSESVELRGGDKIPLLRDFRWSRRLINDCEQMISVYRPFYYGIVEDENRNQTEGIIQIIPLKPDSIKNSIILFDTEEYFVHH